MKQGLFIVFEGPDGSGKSSLCELFTNYLKTQNIDYVLTREPGGNKVELSEKIRTLLLDNENLNISYEAEAYLFASSRAQHIKELIIPSLNNQKVVICDRFLWSSLAYQGYVRNLGIKQVYELNKLAIGNLKPDIIFYIDVDYQLGLDRIRNNQRDQNRLDKELDLHKKVIEGYYEAIKLYPDYHYVILDGTKSLQELLTNVIDAYNHLSQEKISKSTTKD